MNDSTSDKTNSDDNILVPLERIQQAIYMIRGCKVMMDRDLAALYGIETRVLKQAVRRNIRRFPDDFMFTLATTEFKNWRSRFVTSNSEIKKIGFEVKESVGKYSTKWGKQTNMRNK